MLFLKQMSQYSCVFYIGFPLKVAHGGFLTHMPRAAGISVLLLLSSAHMPAGHGQQG